MYWLCMIATISLATGNNCISARGMLAIVWHCVLLFFCVCFLLIFYMLINHLLKKISQLYPSTYISSLSLAVAKLQIVLLAS